MRETHSQAHVDQQDANEVAQDDAEEAYDDAMDIMKVNDLF